MAFNTNVAEPQSKFQVYEQSFTKFLQDELLVKKKTSLYYYQIEAVLKTREHFITHGTNAPTALIVAPTGSGKSGILTMLPYVLGSGKVVVLTPSIIITKQLAVCFGLSNDVDKRQESFFYKTNICRDLDQLTKFLENGKVIHSTKQIKYMSLANLVIVNAQKFGGVAKRSLIDNGEEVVKDVVETFKTFTTLIVDEAHHYPAETWNEIVKNFKNKQIVFLTATPYRKLPFPPYKEGPILENQLVTYEIKRDLVQGRFIRKYTFNELPLELDEDQTILDDTHFRKIGKDIKLILDEHDAVDPSVVHKAMVLTFRTEEAEDGSKFIENATYCTSKKKTDAFLKVFNENTKEFRIIFVCGRLLEGYDNSNVSVCVILRNVISRVLFTQFIGRCVRKSSENDPVTGVVLSYTCFKQKRMWDQFDKLALKDPEKELEEDPEDMDTT